MLAGTAVPSASVAHPKTAAETLRRTAKEQRQGLRVAAFRSAAAARCAAPGGVHPAAGVDELLLAGVERVAVRADLDVQLRLGGAGPELVAARAAHVGLYVLG